MERLHVFSPVDRSFETELHRRFLEYRVLGEWFRHEGELCSYLENYGVKAPLSFPKEKFSFMCLNMQTGWMDGWYSRESDARDMVDEFNKNEPPASWVLVARDRSDPFVRIDRMFWRHHCVNDGYFRGKHAQEKSA